MYPYIESVQILGYYMYEQTVLLDCGNLNQPIRLHRAWKINPVFSLVRGVY